MSHRENIRVIGLKVCTEGRQAIKFLKPGSQTCLDQRPSEGQLGLTGRTDRAAKDKLHRPVVIKLHNFNNKQWILAVTRERNELTYQGSKVYIRQHYSAQVRDARRQYNVMCERLIRRGMRLQLRYAEVLIAVWSAFCCTFLHYSVQIIFIACVLTSSERFCFPFKFYSQVFKISVDSSFGSVFRSVCSVSCLSCLLFIVFHSD